jgi:acetyl/propionyl-CoA carboxylase alpha subunit
VTVRTVLVANRGEIALRVVRTCRAMGLRSVAAHSAADAKLPFVREADVAFLLGPGPARESYLSIPRILEAARATGADAIHPGYGFLSENADFAAAVEEAGLVYIGPRAETIRALGDKVRAKEAAIAAGVPVNGGSSHLADVDAARGEAKRLGYPVLLKAAAGGGGRGMRVVEAPGDLDAAYRAASAEALASFGRSELFLERLVRPARHIEVQVMGDGVGRVVALGERECSVQRRHQKVIEEAPSPAVDAALRRRLCESAERLAASRNYRGAGTVEFLLAPDGAFYFLEMNCRLQVEHPVTEVVMGIDLVAAQLHLAVTCALPPLPAAEPRGWAVEVRVCAEDPAAGFAPSVGRIVALEVPHGGGVRWDGGFVAGDDVSPHYDSLLGKLIVRGDTREQAVAAARAALRQVVVLGPRTNVSFLEAVLAHPDFLAGRLSTSFLDEHFSDWSQAEASDDDIAAALLAAVAVDLSESSGAKRTVGAGALPGPWGTLHGWRQQGGGPS